VDCFADRQQRGAQASGAAADFKDALPILDPNEVDE
jgi:hypothetical protein